MEKGIVLSPDRLNGITIRPIFDDRDLIEGNTLFTEPLSHHLTQDHIGSARSQGVIAQPLEHRSRKS